LAPTLPRDLGVRPARRGSAAAGIGSQSVGGCVRIAFLNDHVRGRDSQFLRDDLSIGGLVSLPLTLGAHAADRFSRGVDADLGAVEHLDAGDVESVRRTGTNGLREA